MIFSVCEVFILWIFGGYPGVIPGLSQGYPGGILRVYPGVSQGYPRGILGYPGVGYIPRGNPWGIRGGIQGGILGVSQGSILRRYPGGILGVSCGYPVGFQGVSRGCSMGYPKGYSGSILGVILGYPGEGLRGILGSILGVSKGVNVASKNVITNVSKNEDGRCIVGRLIEITLPLLSCS